MFVLFSIISNHYLNTALSWLVYFRFHCFSTNQISLLQIFALLQNFALLFEVNCTEVNQSQSSNIFYVYYYKGENIISFV
jgi:hypothetical protein